MTRRTDFSGFAAAAITLGRHLSQVINRNPIQTNFY